MTPAEVSEHRLTVSSNDEVKDFMKQLTANGLNYASTTNAEESVGIQDKNLFNDPIAHLKIYEEIFQKKVQQARFKEQRIPQSAIKKLIKVELDDYLLKTFRKALGSNGFNDLNEKSKAGERDSNILVQNQLSTAD